MKNKLSIAIILIIACAALVFNYTKAIQITPDELLQLTGQEVSLGATTLFPYQGGTGTSTAPTYGKVLVGNAGGTYDVVATSTLGISAGAETDPVWTGVSGNYLLTANAFTQALASTTFQPIILANTYDVYGQATGTITIHNAAYNHANYDTAFIKMLSTSTAAVNGNIPYFSGVNTFANVATTTLTATAPLSLDNPVAKVGGSNSILSCAAASGSVAGCLSAANWTSFNNKWDLASSTIPANKGGTGSTTLSGILKGAGTSAVATAVAADFPTLNQNTTGLAGTATALAADPTDCGANTWATAIAASGNLTCGAITYAGITAMTSANFAGLISDETGTAGKVVFDTNPTLAGLTATGVVDMGGATFELPNGAAVYTNIAGQIGIDTTAPGQLRWNNGIATSTLMGFSTTGFTYATSTLFSATTTIPLAPAVANITFVDARCFTDTGTLNISLNDGTNRANMFNASTTVGVITFTTNNIFTENEKIYIDAGTPASSPTKISCRFKYTYDPI